MTTLVSERLLDASTAPWTRLSQAQCDEACAWIAQHGFDPKLVLTVELDCIDIPLVRCTLAYDGYPTESEMPDAGPEARSDELAHRVAEVAQLVPQPSWWAPQITH